MSNFTIEGDALARGLDNVELFTGSAGNDRVYFSYGFGNLTLLSTDSVAAGCETIKVQTVGEGRFALAPDILEQVGFLLRPKGRVDKSALLVSFYGDYITIGADGEDLAFPVDLEANQEVPDHLTGLLVAAQLRERYLPPRIMLDQKRLARFARVKPDKGERCMDIAFSDVYEPVLVRIGSCFTGLLMPVQRQKNAEALGEDGLWND